MGQSGPVSGLVSLVPDSFLHTNCAVLHTFSGIVWILRFKANRAFYADVPNAFVRFWEADLKGRMEQSRAKGKESLFSMRALVAIRARIP